jgi:branched-chain amino acid transport system permease protein
LGQASPGTWANLTNGPFGLAGIPKPAIFSIQFATIASIAALSMILAVRDDELAARGLGKNVRLIKVQVFAIACAMVAIAGTLYASYVGYIDPTAASLDESMLCMVIVGGVGSFRGPIVGPFGNTKNLTFCRYSRCGGCQYSSFGIRFVTGIDDAL